MPEFQKNPSSFMKYSKKDSTFPFKSPMKHEPWAAKHKEKSAHSATAEAHGEQPTYSGKKGKKVPGGGAASRPENQ